MNLHNITFATENFQKHSKFRKYCALNLGGFDTFRQFSEKDIDSNFSFKHKDIWNLRGFGYWLWKPYIILKALKNIPDGDFVFYSDAGSFFTKNALPIYNIMRDLNIHHGAFASPLIEINWTKSELFNFQGGRFSQFKFKNQAVGSFHPIINSKKSRDFYTELLSLCEFHELINDSVGKQFSEFIDHRHDQSLFSLLYHETGQPFLIDPSQFGTHPTGYSGLKYFKATDDSKSISKLSNGRLFRILEVPGNYKNIIYHFRTKNPYKNFIRYRIAMILKSLNIYHGAIR
jgi:hypothetical protein